MRTRIHLTAFVLALGGAWLVARGQEQSNKAAPADEPSGGRMTIELARLIMVAELDYRHALKLETHQKFKPVREALHESFISDAALQVAWNAKVISDLTSPPESLDEFEKRALERIKAGEREVWEQSQTTARYFRGVHVVGKLCVECHRVLDNRPTIKERDLLAAISIELRPREK